MTLVKIVPRDHFVFDKFDDRLLVLFLLIFDPVKKIIRRDNTSLTKKRAEGQC